MVNGIQILNGTDPVSIVASTLMDREMREVIEGGESVTCSLPRTVMSIRKHSFCENPYLKAITFNSRMCAWENEPSEASEDSEETSSTSVNGINK